MTQPPAEIPESEAQGKIKTIYDDIKATFRVPLVNLIFRTLAAENPDYLQLAWTALKPNVRTQYFEDRSDEIRSLAVDSVASLGTAPKPNTEDVTNVLRVFHYVNARLFLAVAALRSATSGQEPRLQALTAEDKRQVPSGIPDGVPAIDMVDPQSADQGVRQLFDDITTTLGISVVNSDYQALARWPDYLGAGWAALKPIITTGGYREAQRGMRRLAAESIGALPYRMDISTHVLRHAGMTEHDIDALRGTLDRFHALLPGLILNVAFLSAGAIGKEAAMMSPYPIVVVSR